MRDAAVLQNNLEMLATCAPAVHQWLSSGSTDPEPVPGQAAPADWVLENGRPLFGPLPPAMFYASWQERIGNTPTAYLVVGCSLGYGLSQLLDKASVSSVVLVLEPCRELLLATLGLTDYSAQLKNRRLQILVPDMRWLLQAVNGLDLYFLFSSVQVLDDMPCRQIGPEYARWSVAAHRLVEEAQLEMHTLQRFQDVLIGNELRNFCRARRDGHIGSLDGAAQGLGAMILGAGPSLDHVAAELVADRPGLVLATGLQTMPVLQRHGLRPDMCMLIDPAPVFVNIVRGLDPAFTRDIPLYYSTKAHPDAVAAYPGPTRAVWTRGGIGDPALTGQQQLLDTGGNVAVALFRLLVRMGAAHVVLAGQDFGWLQGPSHATGHHVGTVSQTQQKSVKRGDGVVMTSTTQLLTARTLLERDIAAAACPVFNVQGEGLDIQGTQVGTLAALQEQGLLHADAGRYAKLVEMLRQRGDQPAAIPALPGRELVVSVGNVRRRVRGLFKAKGNHQQEIRGVLQQIELFLRGAAPYAPFLFNETTAVAWMARLQPEFGKADKAKLDALLDRVVAKIEEMDGCLVGQEG